MQAVVPIVHVVLVGLFLVAALAKFNQLDNLRDTLVAFGAPPRLSGAIGRALPWIELGTAILLVLPATTLLGAVAAAVLLVVFAAAMAVNLSKGRQPECNCFGQMAGGKIGWDSVARNLALLVFAALVAVTASRESDYSLGASLGAWYRNASPAGFALVAFGCLALGNLWFSLHLLKQNGRLFLLVDNMQLLLDANGIGEVAQPIDAARGLPAGTLAPAFTLPRLGGGAASMHGLRSLRKPIILVFSDPQCGPCTAMLPGLAKWSATHAESLEIAVISRGSQADNLGKMQGIKEPLSVLLQDDREVAEQFKVVATPSAVLINVHGLVDGPLAMGAKDIEALVVSAAQTQVSQAGLAVAGQPG